MSLKKRLIPIQKCDIILVDSKTKMTRIAGKEPTAMKTTELKAAVLGGQFDQRFTYIYGAAALEAQKARYAAAIDERIPLTANW